ncbi:MAG TPA: F0F1 ATP synthase subunit A [Kiritimatiellia bacterium]|nr:F0F1 ATP synthase subunit A [Kiritimatiellia bacterium]
MAEPTVTVVDQAARNEAVMAYVMDKAQNHDYWKLPFAKLPVPEWLTLHGLMLVIASVFLLLSFALAFRRRNPVPSGFANLLELLVLFVRDKIAIANLGEEDGRKMAPLLCTFFFFILTLNLMGLIPLFATATANVNVTAALATTTLGVMIFGAIHKNGVSGFVHAFIPHGVPWPVLIILTPIEVMGMFIKTFSLTIRLFANMFAGHVVIYTLIGLVVMFGPLASASIGLAIGIYVLKIVVALLQAYVFTLLSAMFIAQIHHPAH